MCGHRGRVDRAGRRLADAPALARRLGGALAHRGPDGGGNWTFARRRRPARPSPPRDHRSRPGRRPADGDAGRRTTSSSTARSTTTASCAPDLEARGERFATGSDTEVLLRLIAADGPQAWRVSAACSPSPAGTSTTRSLLLARDRFGIKPLYVAATRARIAFASELRALRAAGLIDRRAVAGRRPRVSRMGQRAAAARRGRAASEAARAGHVAAMAPRRRGRAAVFADCASRTSRWTPRPAHARADLRAAARPRVRRERAARTWSPTCRSACFSPAASTRARIVSAASSVGAADLQTFTVGFDDASSEAARARRVAATVRHARITNCMWTRRTSPQNCRRSLRTSISRRSTPSIPSTSSRAVAATGIKAVLSGAGGDELFGGYPSFARLPRALRRQAAGAVRCWPAARALAGAFCRRGSRALAPLRARERQICRSVSRAARILLPIGVDALAGPALRDGCVWREAADALRERSTRCSTPRGPNRRAASVARLETSLYLRSQLLRDIDVMSMAHGLEVRVPFVDHELLATVWPELARHRALLAGKRAAAHVARASAAAGRRAAAEAGLHAAVRVVDARRARTGRPGRIAACRRCRLDHRAGARGDLARVAVGRGALEPCMGRERPRPSGWRARMSSSAAAMIVTEIEPSTGLRPLDLRELWAYRELLYFLVWRDIKVRYKQTVARRRVGRPAAGADDGGLHASFSGSWRKCRPTACRIRCSPSPALCPGPISPRRSASGALSVVGSQHLISKVYFPRLLDSARGGARRRSSISSSALAMLVPDDVRGTASSRRAHRLAAASCAARRRRGARRVAVAVGAERAYRDVRYSCRSSCSSGCSRRRSPIRPPRSRAVADCCTA